MNSTVYKFHILMESDLSAGIMGGDNTVTILVDYDPGGEPNEFKEALRIFLSEWFDTPIRHVKEKTDYPQCLTHHHACACREEHFKRVEEALDALLGVHRKRS